MHLMVILACRMAKLICKETSGSPRRLQVQVQVFYESGYYRGKAVQAVVNDIAVCPNLS